MPEDRTVKTSDQICHNGISYQDIKNGEKEAEAMWEDFFQVVLDKHKEMILIDNGDWNAIHTELYNLIMVRGQPHSFRLEWVFMRTRVRYFELIPNWEIQRVHDDAETFFQEIVAFREALINDHGVEATGYYSEETLNEMAALKDEIKDFLNRWVHGDDSVYDDDQNRNRKKLKLLTKEAAKNAKTIYYWHYKMAKKQMKWKDGMPHDLVSENYLWSDDTAKFVRPELYNARRNYNFGVRNELSKFNFHFWRRI
jgi:hypothetical protein